MLENSVESSLVESELTNSEAEPTKKPRMRKALSSSLLIQIANLVGVKAAQEACSSNEPKLVHSALKALAKKDADLAKTLGFVEEEKVRVSDVAKINRANAAIINVKHLGLVAGDSVAIDRSVEGQVILRKL